MTDVPRVVSRISAQIIPYVRDVNAVVCDFLFIQSGISLDLLANWISCGHFLDCSKYFINLLS